ncbi:hypothetical protein [Candidatus Formimonas warabiya]|uniref:Uncharacterized protein n=1 Tax=Formimonas warabiya TaxID=1761012 RepID=A0A3G1KTN3_FORW1|nr:hypothetical protein [Candidatus Formimonas warabiya]ATW25515.1 hypothetical protein DCMF_12730 [Candidatus Formimonas warabiya]
MEATQKEKNSRLKDKLKEKRMWMLTAAFVLLWLSFITSYKGGISENPSLIALSFLTASLAGLLSILTRK